MFPPTKRKRMDDSVKNQMRSEGVKRSHSLWFEDGSVILEAQKTQFRVHRSILCNYSKVFQDMFTVPQPESSAMVDGVPLIHVIDDAVDWENVLGIIYFGLKMHEDHSIGVLISMMRLGHKYQFDDIKTAAVQRLLKEFPTNFVEWTNDAASDPHRTIMQNDAYFSRGHEIDLINIASEIQFQQILPVLYYILLRDRPLTEIFDGTMRKDRTVAMLAPETQRILILGRDRILRGTIAHTLAWFEGDITDDCATCQGKRVGNALNVAMGMLTYDVSVALQDTASEIVAGLCNECKEEAETEMALGRQQLWAELPSYFDLPSWDVLAKFNN
ncbi:hypothetical protein JR316_0005560 [Psilocybe cubensis]|uniref:Uncharacterized protein n=2 Tax=Psilocybe cubensis TaxID=181762 RepID=A0ACB8GZI6_PSICU|nr:hypothetical protein JR316_0005560 [Psilocybe cubensis]KAH9481041.1 hypothetical protein JR316_0005560 [Psilocybe cubensis]